MLAVLLCAVAVIVAGIVLFACPNLAWALTKFENDARGVRSKRTSTWEAMQKVGAVALMLTGVALLMVAYRVKQETEVWEREKQQEEQRFFAFDAIDFDCTTGSISVKNLTHQPRWVRVSDVRPTAAERVVLPPGGWRLRPVVEPDGRSARQSPHSHAASWEAVLPAGATESIPLDIPSSLSCPDDDDDDLLELPTLPGQPRPCRSLDFRFETGTPRQPTAVDVVRRCPLSQAL